MYVEVKGTIKRCVQRRDEGKGYCIPMRDDQQDNKAKKHEKEGRRERELLCQEITASKISLILCCFLFFGSSLLPVALLFVSPLQSERNTKKMDPIMLTPQNPVKVLPTGTITIIMLYLF